MSLKTCKNLILLFRIMGWFTVFFIVIYIFPFADSYKKPVELTSLSQQDLKGNMKVKLNVTESFGAYSILTTAEKLESDPQMQVYLIPVKYSAADGTVLDEYYVSIKVPQPLCEKMDKISENYILGLMQSQSIPGQPESMYVEGELKKLDSGSITYMNMFLALDSTRLLENAGLIDTGRLTEFVIVPNGGNFVQPLEYALFIIALASFALVLVLKGKKNNLSAAESLFGGMKAPADAVNGTIEFNYDSRERTLAKDDFPTPLEKAKDSMGENIFIHGMAVSRAHMDKVNGLINECRFDEAKEELLNVRGIDNDLADKIMKNWVMYYR